ncbi:MAG: ABC transporter ATP-binding protein, partial [Acidimicrobiaceae bacterium]|nr:ABC transporter ATP-binding protein [Acidimicrobiaceae bacterium]
FSYPGSERPVIDRVTLELGAGTTNALIGGTGSGKTTLASLIPRFFDATEGRVLVNGVPVTEQSLEDLWASLGVVPQSAFLFSGTIASNLRLGRESASEEDLWWALDVAQAREFVAATPGGLDAPVDQGGTNLSGGQRQRLSIARALVTRAPLLIFDDCFSALDARTDALLRQALREEIADTTTLIVAQRVSTIMDADQIIVLDEGRVVGIGRHEDLVTTCPTYRDIAVSQLGEAALS